VQDDPDPGLAGAVGVAEVGPAVLAADVPGEAVVVVGVISTSPRISRVR
jgi:hypothetical protein